ncbi:MAG: hypothetical protein Q7S92_05150 [Candidatus Diapherotrites archaeon]|nr:hypothetical protein [Candidatus Diapherotrites archaeon]
MKIARKLFARKPSVQNARRPIRLRPELKRRLGFNPRAGPGIISKAIPTRTMPAVTRAMEQVAVQVANHTAGTTQPKVRIAGKTANIPVVRIGERQQGPITTFMAAAPARFIADESQRRTEISKRIQDAKAKLNYLRTEGKKISEDNRIKIIKQICAHMGFIGDIKTGTQLVEARIPEKEALHRAETYVELLDGLEKSTVLEPKRKAELVREIASGKFEQFARKLFVDGVKEVKKDIARYEKEITEKGHGPEIAQVSADPILMAICMQASAARYLPPARTLVLQGFKFLSDNMMAIAARDVAEKLLGITGAQAMAEIRAKGIQSV